MTVSGDPMPIPSGPVPTGMRAHVGSPVAPPPPPSQPLQEVEKVDPETGERVVVVADLTQTEAGRLIQAWETALAQAPTSTTHGRGQADALHSCINDLRRVCGI